MTSSTYSTNKYPNFDFEGSLIVKEVKECYLNCGKLAKYYGISSLKAITHNSKLFKHKILAVSQFHILVIISL